MSTRAALRRAIAKRTRQPFFRRLGVTVGTATSGSKTTLVDTVLLKQPNGFWNGSFVYLVDTDEVREISAFTVADWTLTWLEDVAANVTTDKYEIWSTFTPDEVHDAINRGLGDAWPLLFTIDEQYVVLQEDVGVSYALTGLTPAPRRVAQVLIESADVSSVVGQVTDVVAQDRLKDTNFTFAATDVGKEIRVYGGTSAGDRRTISTLIDANTVQVSANFTSILSTTSKWRMVDVQDHSRQYAALLEWGLDKETDPTVLRLGSHPHGWEGFLLRLTCESEYPALAAETTDTAAPDEYVELTALARLYLIALGNRPESELRAWASMQSTYAEAAEQYAERHRMRHMPGQITDDSAGHYIPAEYPFAS